MKRFRLIGVALVAVFALGAVLSASAFALPEFLIGGEGKPGSYTGKNVGNAILENSAGTQVTCTAAKGAGGFVSDNAGTFKISFEKCKSGSIACKGAGDGTEIILSEGSFNEVFDTLGTGVTLGVATLFLPHETSFECTGFAVSKVKGDVLCLVTTPLTSSTSHTFACKGVAKGKAAEKSYFNDSGTAVTVQLLSSLNGAAFSESNEQAEGTVETSSAGAYMNE